uniref:MSP domain-containing protein n=1 Tax=Steinernema glaseri TaxID=37863 RepID=A0A1I7YAC6_9BILA
NLPKSTVVFGTEGKVLKNKAQPRDCVARWEEEDLLPKTFIYNSKKKTCTPLTSVLGTKKAADGEEAYFIELSQDVCQRNVTKAVEDIT